MLIDPRKKLVVLEKEQLRIAKGLCERPVDQLHLYWKNIGVYHGLTFAIAELRKEVDDDEG